MVATKPSSPALQTGHALYTNLQCCLGFSEGTGNTLDLKNSNDGALQTGATWGTATEGKYVNCDGSSGWIDIASDATMNTAARTFAVWFRTTDTYTQFNSIVSSWLPTNEFTLDTDNLSSDPSQLKAKDPANEFQSDTADVLADDGNWHLAVVTMGTSKFEMWLDNNQYTAVGGTALGTGAQVTNIGTLNSSSSYSMIVDILFYAQWDAQLSTTNIQSLWTDPWGLITASGPNEGSASFSSPIATIAASGAVNFTPKNVTGTASITSPLATIVASGSASGSGSGISGVINADRTTIVAGESVFFDNIGTTSSNTSKPNHHIDYLWDFKDGSNLDNTAKGPWVSHSFRDSGSYIVECRMRDRQGSDNTYTKTITVQDPDTVYATTDTISISNTTDFTGAATSSTRVTTSSLSVAMGYVARGKRVEFHRGHVWTTATGEGFSLATGSGAALITSFGSGAKPLFRQTAVPSQVNTITAAYPNYLALRDIRFENTSGVSATISSPLAADHTGQYITACDCEVDSYTTGVTISPFSPAFYSEAVYQSVCLSRITDTNIVGAEIYYGSGGTRYAMIGLNIGDGDQHLIRFYKGDYFYLARTTFGSVSNDQHQLKAHADASLPGTALSSYWNMHDNHYNVSTNAWRCAIGTQNPATVEDVHEVIIDSDYIDLSAPSWTAGHVVFGSTNVTIRNPVHDYKGNANPGSGAFIGRRGIEPLPTGFEMYHQTCYASAVSGTPIGLEVGTYGAGTPIQKNAIVYAPSGTGAIASGTITGGGSQTTDPSFVNAAASDFTLDTGSTAIDNGVVVDVISSFNEGSPRGLSGNVADSGAYEEIATPTGTSDISTPIPTITATGEVITVPTGTSDMTTPAATFSGIGNVDATPPTTGTGDFTSTVPLMVGLGDVITKAEGPADMTAPLPVMAATGTLTPKVNNVTGTFASSTPLVTMSATGTAPGGAAAIQRVFVQPIKGDVPLIGKHPDPSIVFDLPLWEAGGDPRSIVGSNSRGTTTNATWAHGNLVFDGAGDYVLFSGAHPRLDDVTAPFTFACRAKADSVSGVQRLFGATSTTANGWSIGLTGSAPRLTLWNGPVNIDGRSGFVQAGQWFTIHVSVTPSGVISIYMNGSLLTSTSTGTTFLANTNDWIIGAATTLTEFWTGSVDWLRVRDRAMVQSEVAEEAMNPWRKYR